MVTDVYDLDCGDGFTAYIILISKLIISYILNMYSFLYANNISIKWF